MTCQLLKEAIVERARGMPAGPGTAAAVESHLDACAACVALCEREQALSRGLQAVAQSVGHDEGSQGLEPRLMAAFAAHHPPDSISAHAGFLGAQRDWLAAAAAIVVLAGGLALGLAALSMRTPVPPTSPAGVAPVVGQAEKGGPASTAPTVVEKVIEAADPGAPEPGSGSMDGFVTLPAAIGLPDFESGRIVRVDLPVASLPAYGVAVIPDANKSEVEADVLVGQDGQPRAIRLVSSPGW